MSNDYKHRLGEVIGPWTLGKPLGRGGNAEVWRAQRQGFSESALKILFSRNPNAEAYRRFRDEIAILSELKQFAGILPMLDHSLPSHPSKNRPAWLALPIAIDVTSALGPRPDLEVVIGAVAVIARTLAKLAEKKIFHRGHKA